MDKLDKRSARVRREAGDRLGGWIFALLFGIAYLLLAVESLVSFSPVAAAALSLGLACVLVGTLGYGRVERSGGVRLVVGYFFLQLSLCAVVVYLSGGAAGAVLLLVAVAGQAVLVLARPWVLLVWVAIVVIHSLATPHAPLAQRVQGQLALISAGTLAVAFSLTALRERRARRELDAANRRLREHASTVEELATSEERNRLAREIHDGLGHYLTALGAQIKAARAVLEAGDPDRAAAALSKAEGLSNEVLSDVRRSVGTLRVSAEVRPLPEALAGLVEDCLAAGLPTDLDVAGTPRALSPRAEQGLYRVAQEGLTNARKHARGASRACILLDYGDNLTVRLSVSDDGAGADRTGSPEGFGLLGLRERVGLLGGKMEVETAPGGGFTLLVEVPG